MPELAAIDAAFLRIITQLEQIFDIEARAKARHRKISGSEPEIVDR